MQSVGPIDPLTLASIFGTAAVNTWGVIRFLIGRMDQQDAAISKRVEELRDGMVSRTEYERDMARLHAELTAVREAVTLHGNNHTARIDALILAMGGTNQRKSG